LDETQIEKSRIETILQSEGLVKEEKQKILQIFTKTLCMLQRTFTYFRYTIAVIENGN
jgi:hypothetical protein